MRTRWGNSKIVIVARCLFSIDIFLAVAVITAKTPYYLVRAELKNLLDISRLRDNLEKDFFLLLSYDNLDARALLFRV